MNPHLPSLGFCVAALVSATANAGTVEQAIFIADPQMQVGEGAVQGCGYRIKGMPRDMTGSRQVVLFDTSFNLYSKGSLALMKGGAMQVPIKDDKLGQATNKPIEKFWIKVQGGQPTAPTRVGLLAAETKGYLLYGVSIESAMSLFAAVWDKKPIMIGTRIRGESVDRIYSGTVQVSEHDRAQIIECMDELIKQMQIEIGAEMPARR